MGRGRQKAKQTKVARELKYWSPQTDLERLQQELRGERGQSVSVPLGGREHVTAPAAGSSGGPHACTRPHPHPTGTVRLRNHRQELLELPG
ncbi:MAG: hypothetical protein CSB46_11655 [Micrococcales bacterium]|nr:MAG: hypothetical protein CSB46_11655 [Micrococcales bacterium]